MDIWTDFDTSEGKQTPKDDISLSNNILLFTTVTTREFRLLFCFYWLECLL